MKDKDLTAMLTLLHKVGAPVIFSAIDWHRAAAPADLAARYDADGEPQKRAPSPTAGSAREAIAEVRRRVGANGIVFVCGSLYLVGEAKQAMTARSAA